MVIVHKLTSKSQITIPKQVRDQLGLKPGGPAAFRFEPNGRVYIDRPSTPEEIMTRIGKPSGKQPLTEYERQRGEYLAKKYNVKL